MCRGNPLCYIRRMVSSESRPRLQRRKQPRQTPPISPAGRIAAYTTAGTVVVSGLLWLFFSFRAFSCVHDCAILPALGGLLVLCTSSVLVLMVWMAIQVPGRPVEAGGSSGWMFGLSVIFAFGVLFAATRIPSYACPAGTHLSAFGFCFASNSDRLPASDWRWLKDLAELAGAILAFTLIRARRWVFITAPLAGAVWLYGSLDLLMRRIVRA
jgi:hypothetical protein